MSVTALDILRAAREYAADPDHIVLDSNAVYEDAHGNYVRDIDGAVRGCILGCVDIVAALRGERHSTHEALRNACQTSGGFAATLEAGQSAILGAYDRAIAALEAS